MVVVGVLERYGDGRGPFGMIDIPTGAYLVRWVKKQDV